MNACVFHQIIEKKNTHTQKQKEKHSLCDMQKMAIVPGNSK